MPMSDYMREVRERVGSRMLEIPSVCILCFDEADRVVLVRHSEGDLWTTPGGAVEPMEVPADAAVREMWEETGLHVELLGVCAVYGGPAFTTTYRNGDEVSFLMIAFRARRLRGALRPDGDEVLEVASFARGEIDDLPMFPWARRVVIEAFEKQPQPRFDPPRWQPR